MKKISRRSFMAAAAVSVAALANFLFEYDHLLQLDYLVLNSF